MKRLALLALALCALAPMGTPAYAKLDGDTTLIARLNRLVPAAFLNSPVSVTVENMSPAEMFAAFGTRNVLAFYQDHHIYIRSDLTGYDRDQVLAHEYGHFVEDAEVGMRERQAWVRLWGSEKFARDEYRCSNEAEGFAEAFSFYCCGDEVNRLRDEDQFIRKVQTRIEAWSKTL